MRSLATSSKRSSPTAYSSRTLPECRWRCARPCSDPSVSGRLTRPPPHPPPYSGAGFAGSIQAGDAVEDAGESLEVALGPAHLVEPVLVEWLAGVSSVLA